MPIEVLTREDVEKIVEEKLKKMLLEMEISKRLAQLESATTKLRFVRALRYCVAKL